MASDFTVGGHLQTRFAPKPGRVHPKHGNLETLVTTAYVNARGKRVVLRGHEGDDRPCKSWGLTDGRVIAEECRKARHTLVRGRSKANTATSSGKVEIFVRTQAHTDRAIDANSTPAVVRPGMSKNQRRKAVRYGK